MQRTNQTSELRGERRLSVRVALYNRLSCADPLRHSDLIFVLAGRPERKEFGFNLFRQGYAPKILLSCARFEIRRFREFHFPGAPDIHGVAASVPPPERHFFLLYDGSHWTVATIPVGRFGTLSEIRALANWLVAHPEVVNLTMLSNGEHLRRVRLCCKALISQRVDVHFGAVPVDGEHNPAIRSRNLRPRIWPLCAETAKLGVYYIALKFGESDGVRPTLAGR